MKARSVQFKFLVTVISAILVIAFFVGGLCIYEVNNYVQQHTMELIEVTCSNEAMQVNHIFHDIEKSVKIMESYVLTLFKSSTDIQDRDNQYEMLALAGDMFADVAIHTEGAVAYYLRFDPAISDGKTGMFYTKMNGSNEYISLEPTDLSLYDKDDTEHVGWFWQPYEAGEPIWLKPYYNQNNGILMISYVIPLYFEDQFIGIVGMDFDYTILTERIHEIRVYEHGFAHLELDGHVIHTGNESASTDHALEESAEYMQVSTDLANGMTLVIFANREDIHQIRYDIEFKISLTVILLAVLFILIVCFMVKRIVSPLKKLTDASIQLARGDYDIEITPSNTREIQLLSTAFENMAMNLREHEKLQHLLAYRDPLTGLRNTNSYKDWVNDFNKKIKTQDSAFGVVMLDLNYLKEANDTYGHNVGNTLIVSAARMISDAFKRSPVFRIGGDEFVVILQNRDLEEREALFTKFETDCESTVIEADDITLPISIAKGFSLFDPTTDTEFSDVFDRADEEMYANKKAMKMAQKQ